MLPGIVQRGLVVGFQQGQLGLILGLQLGFGSDRGVGGHLAQGIEVPLVGLLGGQPLVEGLLLGIIHPPVGFPLGFRLQVGIGDGQVFRLLAILLFNLKQFIGLALCDGGGHNLILLLCQLLGLQVLLQGVQFGLIDQFGLMQGIFPLGVQVLDQFLFPLQDLLLLLVGQFGHQRRDGLLLLRRCHRQFIQHIARPCVIRLDVRPSLVLLLDVADGQVQLVDGVHKVLHVALHTSGQLPSAQVIFLQRGERIGHGLAIVGSYLGGGIGHLSEVTDEHRSHTVAACLFCYRLAQALQQVHLFLGGVFGGTGDGLVLVLQGYLLRQGGVDAVVGGLDFIQAALLVQQVRQVGAVLLVDFADKVAAAFRPRLGLLQGGEQAVQPALLVHQLTVHLLQAFGGVVGVLADGNQRGDEGSHGSHGQAEGVQLHHGIECPLCHGHGLGGQLRPVQPQLFQFDGSNVGAHGGRSDSQGGVVLGHEVHQLFQPLHRQPAQTDHIRHHRLQLLAQLHPHLLERLAGFLQLGLHGVVLHVVFVGDAGALTVGNVRVLLLTAHQVDVARQGADDARRLGT